MTKAKFTSNRSQFNAKNRDFKEMATAHMAQDIEILAKSNVPMKKGNLQSSIKHRRITNGFRVEANSPYAAAQEVGRMTVHTSRVVTPDGGKSFFTLKPGVYHFKNYTTPGTGKGWFKKAILRVESRKDNYIRQASRSAKL